MKKKIDNRAKCEEVIWDGSVCKRPAEYITDDNKLLCIFHAGTPQTNIGITVSGEKIKNIINTKATPYLKT